MKPDEFKKRLAVNKRKYRNTPVYVDGERFDSKHERAIYDRLVAEHGAENVIRQVSLPIGGGNRLRVDFMVIWVDYAKSKTTPGCVLVEFIDAKGVVTDTWKAKARHLADKHGIKIRTM